MKRATEQAAFSEEPTGQFVVGRSWIHFCAHPELFGVVLFGRPDRDDVALLTRSLRVELGAGVVPHRSLVDAERIEGADASAFAALNEYVREHHAKLSERVTRLALVHPAGMEGAVVAGFYRVLDPPYPVQLFADAHAALEWLGEPGEDLERELAALVDEATGTEPIVGAVRALFGERLELPVEEACRALGVSGRTLQRRLQDAGTTYQKEMTGARLREAERRMLDSDDPLTTIALDVGFASLQHFSALFRKASGASPSAWRAQHRKAR